LPIIQLYKLFEFCDALITKKTSGHLKWSKAWIVRMAQKWQIKKTRMKICLHEKPARFRFTEIFASSTFLNRR